MESVPARVRSGSIRVNHSETRQRRVVLYQGQVQGVGFRYTTQRVAARHEVSGCVENLPDGRVRLICEGAAGELDRFLAAVDEAMTGYIGHAETSTQPATGEFTGFSIRRS